MNIQYSAYPCGCAHAARQQHHFRVPAHSAHLHSLRYRHRENSDTEAPTHTPAANLSRHEGHRPIYHVGSFYNMLVARQSYLANTICVYFVNFCSRKIVQILDCPMRKQILDNLKNYFNFSSEWLPQGSHDPQLHHLNL